MRTLTATQKKELRAWAMANKEKLTGFDMVSKIDSETYVRIERLHPTEIHYRNCERYLEDLRDKL